MNDSRSRGTLGETLAALFLESRGYRILARNLRAGRREIDLVLERGELLVAVEVKWRRRTGLESPPLAWRPDQRRRAGEAVLAAMAMETIPRGQERPWRFDLVTIEESPSRIELEHRRGAWSPGGSWW